MSRTRTQAPFALALLAATCLTPVAPAIAAPGEGLGPEFQVNSFTTGNQIDPAIAMDADGDFVVAWSGNGPGDTSGVFAQRFNAAGVALGPEFLVNTTTSEAQRVASVAMDADGDFVVAWNSCRYNPATMGTNCDVFAQRYNVAGEPLGSEFEASALAASTNSGSPSVAMDADGYYLIAWTSSDGDRSGIFAQRFDVAGERVGPEFRVNTTTTDYQYSSAVAMDADGDFVVAWRSLSEDGSYSSVFAQRYNASGEPQGGEFQVTGLTTYASDPAVAMNAGGDFILAWEQIEQIDGIWKDSIYAQRYSAAGEPQGGVFLVTAAVETSQQKPTIAMDGDRGFVVAWAQIIQDGSQLGVFARRHDAAGVAQGPEFQVNTFFTFRQERPAVAMDADGDFVVAWQSEGQDGDGTGVFAQRFQGTERVAGDFDGDGKADILWRNRVTGNIVVWLMDGATRLEVGPIGTLPAAWRIASTGDVNGDGKTDILWRNTVNGNAVVWQMNGLERAAAQSIGVPPLAWSVEQLRDTDGDGLADIVWRHAASGATVVWRMSGFTRLAAEPIGQVGADWRLR